MEIIKDNLDRIDILKSIRKNSSKNIYSILISSFIKNLRNEIIFSKSVLEFIINENYSLHKTYGYLKETLEIEIMEILKNSEMFFEINLNYENYISDFVKFLESININSTLIIVKAYNILLERGFFSSTDKKTTAEYKYDNDIYCPELLGSRVTTGISTCKHDSSLLSDILRTSGKLAFNLYVFVSNVKNSKKIKMLRTSPLPNHQVTCIIDNKEKYVYDPIYNSVGIFTKNLEFDDEDDLFLSSLNKDLLYKACISKEYLDYSNPKNEENLEELLKYDSKRLTREYEEYCYMLAYSILEKRSSELEDFKKEHKLLIKKISQMNRELIPTSNSKIKSWKVK